MAITLVIGGVSSGKSSYAEELASKRAGHSVLYVATSQAGDEEMREKIARHQARRPSQWKTCEVPLDLIAALDTYSTEQLVLIETVSGWIANLLFGYTDEEWRTRHVQEEVMNRVDNLLACLEQQHQRQFILVSDEAGLGGVIPNRLGRVFQQCVGLANQRIAARADEVIAVMAGLPLILKKGYGGKPDEETNQGN